jgi:hypothetical protein
VERVAIGVIERALATAPIRAEGSRLRIVILLAFEKWISFY